MSTTFETKTWVDRVSEYPARRTLTDEDGNATVYTVTRNEGTVSEEGDAFSAENMNDLESRIATAVDAKLDGTTLVSDYDTAVATTVTGTAPDCTVIAAMYANFMAGCSAIAAALNSAGVATASNASPSVMANNIAVVASESYESGYAAAKVGTATAARVLKGYTFTNASNVGATGTMNNWSASTVTLSSSNTATLPAGYYSGITVNAAGRYTAGYNSATLTITSVGNISSNGASVTLNCQSVTGYASMTANNFAVCITNVTANATDVNTNGATYATFGTLTATSNVSKSYNASSGVLTVTGLGANATSNNTDNTWQRKATATVTARVWCYYIA